MLNNIKRLLEPSAVIRRASASWISAAAIEYLLLDGALKTLTNLDGLAKMSLLRVIAVTLLLFLMLCALSYKKDRVRLERGTVVGAFGILAVASTVSSFTLPYMIFCAVVFGICAVYFVKGADREAPFKTPAEFNKSRLWLGIAIGFAAVFFILVSLWTVCRVLAYLAPTYDFGIFAQMYESMRKTGIPVTTLERVTTMSHFKVHVSPIYYLLLPFYLIVPRPETLQILQAAVIASSAIPMWKLAKHHNFSPMMRALMCAVMLFYPTMAGGAGYDLHENCFLAPLVLWMLYGMDKVNIPITVVASVLTLTVKEDSAVYVAVAALWLVVRSLTRGKEKKMTGIILGGSILVLSVIYFLCTTSYLANIGDGVMSGRYKNFLYGGSDSLITVIKAVIMSPMKALFECVDPDKLKFIMQTLLPLLGLPLITRKYDRYILLIPYVLLNLMSDYPYQHSVYFQYTFASSAFLVYLTLVNVADIRHAKLKPAVLIASTAAVLTVFAVLIIPKAAHPIEYYFKNTEYFADQTENLKRIPEDASVTATCYYTTRLSNHDVVYDIYYATEEQLYSSDYIVLDKGVNSSYSKLSKKGEPGYNVLVRNLRQKGYRVFHNAKAMIIYYKPEN